MFCNIKKKILYLQYKPAPVKKVSPVTSTSSVSSSRLPQRPAYGQGGGTGTDRISELNCKVFPKSLQAALAHLISCSVKACSNMIQDLIFWYHQQLHSWQYWMCEKTDPGTFFFFFFLPCCHGNFYTATVKLWCLHQQKIERVFYLPVQALQRLSYSQPKYTKLASSFIPRL